MPNRKKRLPNPVPVSMMKLARRRRFPVPLLPWSLFVPERSSRPPLLSLASEVLARPSEKSNPSPLRIKHDEATAKKIRLTPYKNVK